MLSQSIAELQIVSSRVEQFGVWVIVCERNGICELITAEYYNSDVRAAEGLKQLQERTHAFSDAFVMRLQPNQPKQVH